MLLAQGRFWRALWSRKGEVVRLEIDRESLPEELAELQELRVEIALERWQRLTRTVRGDRKLLGGVLLEGAHPEALLSRAIGNDRLASELQQVLVDATIALVEAEVLNIAPASSQVDT